jgi:hypothetical protein
VQYPVWVNDWDDFLLSSWPWWKRWVRRQAIDDILRRRRLRMWLLARAGPSWTSSYNFCVLVNRVQMMKVNPFFQVCWVHRRRIVESMLLHFIYNRHRENSEYFNECNLINGESFHSSSLTGPALYVIVLVTSSGTSCVMLGFAFWVSMLFLPSRRLLEKTNRPTQP